MGSSVKLEIRIYGHNHKTKQSKTKKKNKAPKQNKTKQKIHYIVCEHLVEKRGMLIRSRWLLSPWFIRIISLPFS